MPWCGEPSGGCGSCQGEIWKSSASLFNKAKPDGQDERQKCLSWNARHNEPQTRNSLSTCDIIDETHDSAVVTRDGPRSAPTRWTNLWSSSSERYAMADCRTPKTKFDNVTTPTMSLESRTWKLRNGCDEMTQRHLHSGAMVTRLCLRALAFDRYRPYTSTPSGEMGNQR